ncbi:MAG TPA: DUF1523 family protein [Paracoccus sp. (in: a-proteobacteria)]|uniref:DUF1523 family protein n=1 Tax=uncultured Paracoccus sp. TaxID=189685 RepID=UPI0026195E63|nr:DUF1523 family protein [uncultured Paracoccus sp.]HMQ41919.1 DUF1523 family protein [Paracoccus sp. (in: a-proteobacteria)]HMR37222.1 DUF1523 family protein [Paracoccus sp. (in: a-proteobacteria)]
MMHYIKVFLGVLLGVAVFMFLDYALPSKNTVRVTNTYNRLTEIGSNRMFYAAEDTGTVQNAQGQRDIRFIETVRPNGKVHVYRNEDTGWIWPPYFKYDSSNLQAEATDFRSDANNPQWVSVTSYGWRIPMFSIYPNAISMHRVDGPTVAPLNWPAMLILGVMGVLLALLWRMWNQFRERTIDPAAKRVSEAVESVDSTADAAIDRVSQEFSEAREGFTGWLDTWKGKPRDPK